MSELLHLLKRTGLNEYESKAYAALLQLDSATAADVSKRADIPRARVYDVLVGLEKKGFLAQELARPIKFKALHPETALGNLESARKREFAAELSALSELKGALNKHAASLKKESKNGEETAYLISGTANILAKMQELLKGARQEAVICTNGANAVRKANILKKIMKDGSVSAPVRFYSSSTIDLKQHLPELENVVFQHSEKACRFMVFDESKALLFLDSEPKENERALLIESAQIARYLKETIR